MAEIVDFVKEHDVKVIFFDGLASSKVAEAVLVKQVPVLQC